MSRPLVRLEDVAVFAVVVTLPQNVTIIVGNR